MASVRTGTAMCKVDELNDNIEPVIIQPDDDGSDENDMETRLDLGGRRPGASTSFHSLHFCL
jgi:hypothetical protein